VWLTGLPDGAHTLRVRVAGGKNPEGPEPGHILLQEQNGEVQFRNIRIKKL